jgi:hypothetical protein
VAGILATITSLPGVSSILTENFGIKIPANRTKGFLEYTLKSYFGLHSKRIHGGG